MMNTEKFMKLLAEEANIEEFCGTPCSNLKYLINYAEKNGIYTEVPSEGDAVAYSVGNYLGNKRVAVMMQNSGFTNALNPITSLSYIYRIPQLYIIGHRGKNGPGTDEPQHELAGSVTEQWLIDCRIKVLKVEEFTSEEDLVSKCTELLKADLSVAILVDKKDFSEYSPLELDTDISSSISRDDVLRCISDKRDAKTVVVTTTGFTSRAMYDKFRDAKNFMSVGSMGCALAIGCGIAKAKPDYKVIVVDGDGAIMMRPSVAILAESLKLKNLCHIVINNGKYESTGSQYCPGLMDYDLDSMLIGLYGVTESRYSFNEIKYLEYYLDQFYKGTPKSPFIIMNVNTSNNDNNLGRPDKTSLELRNEFMEAIN